MALALDPRFVVELGPDPARRQSPAVYRRRRLLVCGGAVAAVAIAVGGVSVAEQALAGRGSGPASAPTASPDHARPYVVQPGDTLWSIAGRFRGERSLGGYVEQLVAANGGPDIQVGQHLQLP